MFQWWFHKSLLANVKLGNTWSPYLIPGVGSFGWVDKYCDEFGIWQQGVASLGGNLTVKIRGTLLKQHGTWVGLLSWEKFHVPEMCTEYKSKIQLYMLWHHFIIHRILHFFTFNPPCIVHFWEIIKHISIFDYFTSDSKNRIIRAFLKINWQVSAKEIKLQS